jgi:DNA-binding CsgD family transcriptional regulator
MAWTSIPARAVVDASQIAALVDHLEDDRFEAILLDMLREMAPVAEVNGFFYALCDGAPRPVGWCGRRAGTANRVHHYIRGFHRFDPTLHSLPRPNDLGETLVDVLMPGTVTNESYRRTCFEAPALRQKISIAHAYGGEWTILNMYLGDQSAGPNIVQRLTTFGSLVAPFLRRRGRALGMGRFERPGEGAADRVAGRLRRRFPMLTERERCVCAMTMIGKSSSEIAETLGIKPGTVLTYRRRAYERLGVSSAASLVAEIL